VLDVTDVAGQLEKSSSLRSAVRRMFRSTAANLADRNIRL